MQRRQATCASIDWRPMEDRARITLRADAAAPHAACGFVEHFAQAQGIAREDLARILIVVEELATNVVKYGFVADPGLLQVRARHRGGRLTIALVDDGAPFDPFNAPEPDFDAPLEARRVGGLGLAIVAAWMDHTQYRRAGPYNVVVVSRALTAA